MYGIAGTLAVIVIIVVGSELLHSAPQITQATIPYVSVSGSVATVGLGTKPISVDFTSDNGQTQTETVSGGSYSATLSNQHTYGMMVHYSEGLGLATSQCNGGSLSLYSTSSSLQHDISC